MYGFYSIAFCFPQSEKMETVKFSIRSKRSVLYVLPMKICSFHIQTPSLSNIYFFVALTNSSISKVPAFKIKVIF